MQAAPGSHASEQRFWQAGSDARKLLGDALQRDRDRYLLDRGRIRLDLDELERLLVEAERAADKKAEIELATGQAQPKPLMKLVHDVARTRPLLLIGTVGFEREFDRAYTRRTKAQLWQLPQSAHTRGLEDHPHAYARRVLALFDAL